MLHFMTKTLNFQHNAQVSPYIIPDCSKIAHFDINSEVFLLNAFDHCILTATFQKFESRRMINPAGL